MPELVGHASACQASEARPWTGPEACPTGPGARDVVLFRSKRRRCGRGMEAGQAACLNWWGMLQLARRAKLAPGQAGRPVLLADTEGAGNAVQDVVGDRKSTR